jgi:hypothetical protein
MKPTYWISQIYDPNHEFILFVYNTLLTPFFFTLKKKINLARNGLPI